MASLKEEHKKKSTFLRNWGAVLLLFVFFVASWMGQLFMQLQVEMDAAAQHEQTFSMAQFWPQFWSSTLENWQSEWLQLFTQALMISGFAAFVFRTENQEHYKTQIMIDELRKEIRGKA